MVTATHQEETIHQGANANIESPRELGSVLDAYLKTEVETVINDDLADSIDLEWEISTSEFKTNLRHIQGHSEFIGSDSMENLKQYSDCKFKFIKC